MSDTHANSSEQTSIWTPANVVTVVRIALIPIFVVALLSPWPDWMPDAKVASILQPWVAALIFTLLSCTDAVDGYLARSRGEVTNFGKFVDPLADKILVCAALIALAELQILPSWISLIIIAREFIVSGLRMLAASEGVVIAASWVGKVKTVSQIVAIVFFIVKDSVLLTHVSPLFALIVNICAWIIMLFAVVMTIASMMDYFAKSSQLLGFKSANTRRDNAALPNSQPDQDVLIKDPILNCEDLEQQIEALSKRIIDTAASKGLTIGTAESCTGGLIAGALTSIPGSSQVIEGGIVSYSNDIKRQVLNVSKADLDTKGAVSQEVAAAMAQGALTELSVSLAVSVTGIAGPSGGSADKPVGTVWFGVATQDETTTDLQHFSGSRDEIRAQTVFHALKLIEKNL